MKFHFKKLANAENFSKHPPQKIMAATTRMLPVMERSKNIQSFIRHNQISFVHFVVVVVVVALFL